MDNTKIIKPHRNITVTYPDYVLKEPYDRNISQIREELFIQSDLIMINKRNISRVIKDIRRYKIITIVLILVNLLNLILLVALLKR